MVRRHGQPGVEPSPGAIHGIIDGDGDPDIAVANQGTQQNNLDDGNVSVLLNQTIR